LSKKENRELVPFSEILPAPLLNNHWPEKDSKWHFLFPAVVHKLSAFDKFRFINIKSIQILYFAKILKTNTDGLCHRNHLLPVSIIIHTPAGKHNRPYL
jgi:hypothetical protein